MTRVIQLFYGIYSGHWKSGTAWLDEARVLSFYVKSTQWAWRFLIFWANVSAPVIIKQTICIIYRAVIGRRGRRPIGRRSAHARRTRSIPEKLRVSFPVRRRIRLFSSDSLWIVERWEKQGNAREKTNAANAIQRMMKQNKRVRVLAHPNDAGSRKRA